MSWGGGFLEGEAFFGGLLRDHFHQSVAERVRFVVGLLLGDECLALFGEFLHAEVDGAAAGLQLRDFLLQLGE